MKSSRGFLLLLLVQLAATAGMAAVIWFVQLVTYPQFAEISPGNFADYHASYSSRITLLVGPLMCAELACAVIVAFRCWSSSVRPLALAGLLLAAALWAITGAIQVPQHGKLATGFDLPTIRSLVAGNWIRTILWTIRLGLVLALCLPWIQGVASPRSSRGSEESLPELR